MSNQTATSDDNPFDVTRIRQLVRLMRDNDLAEIDLRWVDARIRLRRGGDQVVTAISPAPAPVLAPAPQIERRETTGGSDTAATNTTDYITITSPIVGTFYAAPNPESERYVTVGSRVTPETTVCIIEAMKVFNEIPAGVSGTIREILVEDGTPVEFGQPLFHVDAS